MLTLLGFKRTRFNNIALEYFSEVAVYYIEKGVLCYRVKLADEGIRALNKAKELAPEVADVYYLLGCLYIGKNETELARENLEKAHSLGHPDALVKLNVLK